MEIDFKDFCAEGCQVQKRYIKINSKLSLQIIAFHPPTPTKLPPVLFIPGWISQMVTWQSVLQVMTKNFTVYYLETREKESAISSNNLKYTVDAFSDDINKVIKALNLPNQGYFIFASSLGATAVLNGLSQFTISPLCAILIGPNAEFRIPPFWLNIVRYFPPRLYLLIKPVIKWYLRNFRLNTAKDYPQYLKYCHNLDHANPWRLKKAALSFAKYKVWDKLPSISCPVLIVGASYDHLHDNNNLLLMKDIIPSAYYVDLKTNSRSHSPEIMNFLQNFISKGRFE